MRVASSVPRQAATPTVLCIGNFDGMHLGHRAMLARLRASAEELNLSRSVLTFEPNPREVLSPSQAPARLSSLREKLSEMRDCGVDCVYVLRFDMRFAELSADQFVEQVLVHGLSVRRVVVGADFCFGKGRVGNVAMLREAGRQWGFSVETLGTVEFNGARVSSSAVRRALAAGDLEQAAKLLGRPYSISGRIGHGDKIGRSLGFPTANVQLGRRRLPMSGIFAVTVSGIDLTALQGAASLGVRPSIGAGLKPTLEVYLLDFNREIYGARVTVNFLHRIRDEVRFESMEALGVQIADDVAATRKYFSGPKHG